MQALRHHIKVTYKHQPARRHLVPITMRRVSSSESVRAISSFIPVVEPYWPGKAAHQPNVAIMGISGTP